MDLRLRLARPPEIPSRSAGSLAALAEAEGFDVMTQYDPETHYLRVTATHKERGLAFIANWAEGKTAERLVWRKPSRFPATIADAELRRLVRESGS